MSIETSSNNRIPDPCRSHIDLSFLQNSFLSTLEAQITSQPIPQISEALRYHYKRANLNISPAETGEVELCVQVQGRSE